MTSLLVLTPTLTRHVLLALTRHSRALRLQGVRPPAELNALMDMLAATSGQHVTNPVELAPQVEPDHVSTVEAAHRLGVSSRTVRRMIADGRLDSARIGRRVVIPVASVRGYGGSR